MEGCGWTLIADSTATGEKIEIGSCVGTGRTNLCAIPTGFLDPNPDGKDTAIGSFFLKHSCYGTMHKCERHSPGFLDFRWANGLKKASAVKESGLELTPAINV